MHVVQLLNAAAAALAVVSCHLLPASCALFSSIVHMSSPNHPTLPVEYQRTPGCLRHRYLNPHQRGRECEVQAQAFQRIFGVFGYFFAIHVVTNFDTTSCKSVQLYHMYPWCGHCTDELAVSFYRRNGTPLTNGSGHFLARGLWGGSRDLDTSANSYSWFVTRLDSKETWERVFSNGVEELRADGVDIARGFEMRIGWQMTGAFDSAWVRPPMTCLMIFPEWYWLAWRVPCRGKIDWPGRDACEIEVDQ